jgi:hypothetical protein
MKHPYQNYVVCRNNYLNNPQKVLELFKKQTFSKSGIYPGHRTENLFDSADQDTVNFATFFANRIRTDVFPGISKFMIDIRFHINEVYNNDDANLGWIHNDESDLAGILYLTPDEIDFTSGTSIFNKKNKSDFATDDFNTRLNFNLTGNVTDEYLTELHTNWLSFDETIRVGNVYNRLLAYDAKLYHRPNSFVTATSLPRHSVIFFIQGFSCESTFNPASFNWSDE